MPPLGGMEETFVLRYIENGLTSNLSLAPLAHYEMNGRWLLVAKTIGNAFSDGAGSN